MTLRDLGRNAAYRSLYVFDRGGPAHLILLYHSVGARHAFSVPTAAFDAQMAHVAQHFTAVPLADLQRALTDGHTTGGLASVTFDDGYCDNYEQALPILERHGLRGTFFVATGFVGRSFRSWAGDHPMMTPQQVRAVAERGHEIGAHSVTHVRLTGLPAAVVRREASDSKAFLEDLVGRPVRAFAYPKGAYDDTVKRVVAEAGFVTAATIREEVLAATPDWLALPRFVVHEGLSRKAFEAKLSRAGQWYHRLRRQA